MWSYAFFVATGAMVGALLRWKMGSLMNSLLPYFPLGTLAVNLIGCYLIGLVIPIGNNFLHISTDFKLFFITGFLGSFTTFSTFSAEINDLVFHKEYLMGLIVITLHVVGSIVMTFLGVLTIKGVFFHR